MAGTLASGAALQFGHGGEAVENLMAIKPKAESTKLQFGHGGEAVENTHEPRVVITVGSKLQFGHGGEAVENYVIGPWFGFGLLASIRPRR